MAESKLSHWDFFFFSLLECRPSLLSLAARDRHSFYERVMGTRNQTGTRKHCRIDLVSLRGILIPISPFQPSTTITHVQHSKCPLPLRKKIDPGHSHLIVNSLIPVIYSRIIHTFKEKRQS